MDEQELVVELVNFLDENKLYQTFLNWAGNRGFDISQMEADIEKVTQS